MPIDPLELLSMARGFLERFSVSGMNENVPPELLDGLALYETHLKKQVDRILPSINHLTIEYDKDVETLKSRLKQQFTDRRQHGYRLHSVFIHRGIESGDLSDRRGCCAWSLLDLHLRFCGE